MSTLIQAIFPAINATNILTIHSTIEPAIIATIHTAVSSAYDTTD